MTTLLEITQLTGGYGDTNVVLDISAKINSGEVLGVLGRNGVGKTTLARLIQGGLPVASGALRLRGRDIAPLKAHQRRALGIGYMPQTNMVFDDLTVQENLTLGKNARSTDMYFDHFPKIAERRDQPAGTMSGGERKILAFIRTMIEDTDILILDEPSEGVQPENIDRMAQCINARRSEGAGVLLCEQNLGFLTGLAAHYLGLNTGMAAINDNKENVTQAQLHAILSL